MIGLLALAAVAQPVEAAERAFASMAQTKGQWTAFRAFAAPDAIMILDGPQPAAPFLKDRADPPVAVMWWPAHTITSCDGTLALSTGPWLRRGGTAAGRYFTIWRRDRTGWRWIYDGGTEEHVATPVGDEPVAVKATCRSGRPPALPAGSVAGGGSRDGTLQWELRPVDTAHFRLTITYRASGSWKTEKAIVG